MHLVNFRFWREGDQQAAVDKRVFVSCTGMIAADRFFLDIMDAFDLFFQIAFRYLKT